MNATTGATPTCQAPPKVGERCSGLCDGALFCVPSDEAGGDPICMAPASRGQACDRRYQCGGYFGLLACDETTHKCVDLPSSGPCLGGDSDGCNPLTSYCDSTTSQPTCKPWKPMGAACSLDELPSGCGGFSGAFTCEPDAANPSTGTCTRRDPGPMCGA